jgi:dihydroflavonol-4-reductase
VSGGAGATRPRLLGPGSILVTGATGFLGQHLVSALLEAGVAPSRLRLLGRRFPASQRQLAASGVQLLEASLAGDEGADAGLLDRAVAGCTLVYHLAGQVSRRRQGDTARLLHQLHVDGTRRLGQAILARAPGARLVLASTSGTIAVSHRPPAEVTHLVDEQAPYPLEAVARWPYYLSKIYQEQTALDLHRRHGLELVVCNPSLLLGPGDERDSSTGDVLAFLMREIPAVPEGGMSFVDVRDTAAAFVAAADAGRSGQRYLLGAANWTLAQFFGRLERLSGVRAPRLAVPRRLTSWMQRGLRALEDLGALGPLGQGDAPAMDPVSAEMATACWWFSSARAEEELGFRPRDPGETLADTLRDLRVRHGLDTPRAASGTDAALDPRFVPWAGDGGDAPGGDGNAADGEPGADDHSNPWRPRGSLGAKRRVDQGQTPFTGTRARRWRRAQG